LFLVLIVIPAFVQWSKPLALLIWFVRTLTAMAASLRDITERLLAVEQAIRDAPRGRVT
jgi:hypothetical protein